MSWSESAYARAVIDMHITEDDPSFLSRFDPDDYVRMLSLCGAQSAVVYAHSHVGLCNFPTLLGKRHDGLPEGALGAVIEGCHQAGIAVVAYLSAIFDSWAYRTHEHWRIRDSAGNGAADGSRYGICCPNSPYRDHIAGLAREVCEQYEVEGVRFDMTFWPRVCFCRHCAARYDAEVGGPLPTVIDWADRGWVAFQRARERWLVEFAHHLTDAVRAEKPNASVEHQASTFTQSWNLGVTYPLAGANDFLQGDFYGDALQGSFVRKLFLNLSPGQPYGFETSIGVDLQNYTALKPLELLQAKASAAVADAGAFVFIDSIDPDGSLRPAVFERMREVFAITHRYAPDSGGEPVHDLAIYLSTESKHDPEDSGKPVDGGHLSGRLPHVDACLGAARALIGAHVPYGVITKADLGRLSRHRAILLLDVLTMDEEEVASLREYVRLGGKLLATGRTSLTTKAGEALGDFALGGVLGVRHAGATSERFTYVAPTGDETGLLPGYDARWPLGFAERLPRIEAHDGARTLATLTLPFFDPDDPGRYASIHNNPPGHRTAEPTVVASRFGEGAALYSSATLSRWAEHDGAFLSLIEALGIAWSATADAPPCVEMTVFHQPERRRYVVSLLNFPKQLPGVPVREVAVRLRLPHAATSARLLPDGAELPLVREGGALAFTVPEVGTLAMVGLAYE